MASRRPARVLLMALPAVLSLLPCAAQDGRQEQLSVAHTARAAGLGGALSSVPEGIESLLYNPAGISAPLPGKDIRWTFMLGADGYFQPEYLFPMLDGAAGGGNAAGQLLVNAKNLITTSGTGASFRTAAAFTGRSWGSGVFLSGAVFLSGEPFPLGSEGHVRLDLSVPVAYSFTAFRTDGLELGAGILLRPGLTVYKELDGSDVDALVGGTRTAGQLVSSAVAHPYLSLPADAGAILTLLDRPYKGAQLRLSVAAKDLFGGCFVPGGDARPLPRGVSVQGGTAIVLPFRFLGVGCHVLASLELHGVNRMVSGGTSFWDALRMGVEFSAGGVLRVQAGLAGGYPCLGVELSLLRFSLGCSWQTVETGRYIGDNPLSVFRLAAAFRLG